jgi:hypothetical protein
MKKETQRVQSNETKNGNRISFKTNVHKHFKKWKKPLRKGKERRILTGHMG